MQTAVSHYAVSSSLLLLPLLNPNALLSTLFSNTLSLCCSLNVKGSLSLPYINVLLWQTAMYLQTVTDHTMRKKRTNIHFPYLQLPKNCQEFAWLKACFETIKCPVLLPIRTLLGANLSSQICHCG